MHRVKSHEEGEMGQRGETGVRRQRGGIHAVAFMLGRPAPYTERLQFEVPRGGTVDVDETMISQAMLDQMGEKLKDLVGKGRPAG